MADRAERGHRDIEGHEAGKQMKVKEIILKETPHIPIDKTARIVTWVGEHFKINNPKGIFYQKDIYFKSPPHNIQDLRDQTNGRMTIIGYRTYSKLKGGKGRKHTWWARCSCGNIEIRNHKQWLRDANKGWVDNGCRVCIITDGILK